MRPQGCEKESPLSQALLGMHWLPLNMLRGEPDKRRAVFRARKWLAGLVHDMAALEGNPFTFPEVQTLLDGVTVGGHRVTDEQQVLNTAEAWQWVLTLVAKGTFSLSKDTFFALHSIVARGEALTLGAYRDGPVGISGTDYEPPPATHLSHIFDHGLAAILDIEDVHERAFAFFLFGALAQFFWDGNKRTSRLMMAGELLNHGYDMANIPLKKKQFFHEKMLRFYETKNASEMMAFLAECVLI